MGYFNLDEVGDLKYEVKIGGKVYPIAQINRKQYEAALAANLKLIEETQKEGVDTKAILDLTYNVLHTFAPDLPKNLADSLVLRTAVIWETGKRGQHQSPHSQTRTREYRTVVAATRAVLLMDT
jgi:hypothetical protein